MQQSPLNELKKRVIGKKIKTKGTTLTGIFDAIRNFSCLGEVIGREYEVMDKNENVLYVIKQKPITLNQLNLMLKELNTLKKIDAELEAMKWGSKKRFKRPRKR